MNSERVSYNQLENCGSVQLLKSGQLLLKQTRNKVERHTPNYLFHYVTAGSGWVSFENGSENSISKGDWFFCFPGQKISYWQNPVNPWLYRWIEFSGDEIIKILNRMGIFSDTHQLKNEYDKKIESMIEEMRELFSKNSIANAYRGNARLLDLFAYMLDQCAKVSRQKKIKPTTLEDTVEKAMRFMKNHFTEGLQVNQVVDYIGFERSYFSKVFAEVKDVSIQETLLRLREEKAKELLKNDDYAIGTISQTLGFSEAKVFSRFFKSRTGLSPKRWREKT